MQDIANNSNIIPKSYISYSRQYKGSELENVSSTDVSKEFKEKYRIKICGE